MLQVKHTNLRGQREATGKKYLRGKLFPSSDSNATFYVNISWVFQNIAMFNLIIPLVQMAHGSCCPSQDTLPKTPIHH